MYRYFKGVDAVRDGIFHDMNKEKHNVHQIYFVTKVVHRRIPVFSLDEKYPLIVIENLKFYREKFGFLLYGFVIMSDHYHLVVDTVEKVSISKIKEDMNKHISREIIQELKIHNTRVLERLRIDPPLRKGHRPHEYRLFQKGRYDFEIVTPTKLLEKLEYMHKNPVRARLVECIEDYRHSSARNYLLEDDSLIVLDTLPI
jgi:putative transposase